MSKVNINDVRWDDEQIQVPRKKSKKIIKFDDDKEHDRNVKKVINQLRRLKQDSIDKEEW